MESNKLVHLIYASTGSRDFNPEDLNQLLGSSRLKNSRLSITGLLLHIEGTFFQVLEGDEKALSDLFATIRSDHRHKDVTMITYEPIAERAFTNWTMGYAEISRDEIESLDGFNDFFREGNSLSDLPSGRAKKLLSVFSKGHWHAPSKWGIKAFSFAFQPIIDTKKKIAYAHEALVRGLNNEPASHILKRYRGKQIPVFDAACRSKAIELASRIGLGTDLSLNLLPSAAMNVNTGLDATIEAAEQHSFPANKIIIEVLESETIDDRASFSSLLNEYRGSGMRFAIDDFGAGSAGLHLLSELHPDIIKLDMCLVRDIHMHGPRQAIVRGIKNVCVELGIDLVIEGVETVDEYSWFVNEGLNLFQGYLFARPMFESMRPFQIPSLRP